MDGAKVFVPAVRSGELTPEQFKMQLKMGEAVNKGFIEDRFELNKMRGSAQFIEEFNFVEDIDEPIIKESDKNINRHVHFHVLVGILDQCPQCSRKKKLVVMKTHHYLI